MSEWNKRLNCNLLMFSRLALKLEPTLRLNGQITDIETYRNDYEMEWQKENIL